MHSKFFRFHSFLDKKNYIKSFGSKAFICKDGIENSFYFDNLIFTLLANFKLIRRLLRLNRSTKKNLIMAHS